MTFDYKRYLASREWALLKEQVRERSGGYCERCGLAAYESTHHLTYERIGAELLEDLLAVCNECHEFLSAKSQYDPAKDVIVVAVAFNVKRWNRGEIRGIDEDRNGARTLGIVDLSHVEGDSRVDLLKRLAWWRRMRALGQPAELSLEQWGRAVVGHGQHMQPRVQGGEFEFIEGVSWDWFGRGEEVRSFPPAYCAFVGELYKRSGLLA